MIRSKHSIARWALLAILALTLSACGNGDTNVSTFLNPSPNLAPSGTALLAREIILPVSEIHSVLPEIAIEIETGLDTSALGSPTGSRLVTFADKAGLGRLVLSVARYSNATLAAAAFEEAVNGSLAAPGGEGQLVSGLGERAFIGSSAQGGETHVGGGALSGNLIVTATLQAYPPTEENRNKVIEIIRREAARAPLFL